MRVRQPQGFTLIEVLVVLAIICMLAVFALPSPEMGIMRKQVVESLDLIEDYKKLAAAQYSLEPGFATDNKALGIPRAEFIKGNYLDKVEVENGVFHLYFGSNASSKIKDKVLSIQPLVVTGSEVSPISWRCGYGKIPEGMQAVGDNKTSVEQSYLPFTCRNL
ncbi:MAG TPA: prepilin-type N-terminal cleavage/methylation domain-containing protein [Cellvibrio sp.]|nr:prepilin-type N-terminal cleavage/methylation domain-containing protein [Cellvibrio sp.]